MRPVYFRVVGMEPISAKDNILVGKGGNIEFCTFLMKVRGMVLDSQGLDRGVANGSLMVQGAIYIADREWLQEASQGEVVLHSKGMAYDDSFSSTIKESLGTDFFS